MKKKKGGVVTEWGGKVNLLPGKEGEGGRNTSLHRRANRKGRWWSLKGGGGGQKRESTLAEKTKKEYV